MFSERESHYSITEEKMFVLPDGMFSQALGYHIGRRMLNYIKIQKKGMCLELHHQHVYL